MEYTLLSAGDHVKELVNFFESRNVDPNDAACACASLLMVICKNDIDLVHEVVEEVADWWGEEFNEQCT